MGYVIHIQKESFKFSGSHFTIFSETSAERLHGHNYYVAVDISVKNLKPGLGMAFDFNDAKPVIKHLCDRLDEYVLIPEQSQHLKVKKSNGEIEVRYAHKRYVFPEDDVMLLPLENLTSEELARYLAVELAREFKGTVPADKIRVSVKETQGQSVSYSLSLKDRGN